jgi:hypothetical protein
MQYAPKKADPRILPNRRKRLSQKSTERSANHGPNEGQKDVTD